ncbi:ribonucleoside-diphosphate reductase subunit alpha [Allofournierella sp.]|uniref:ribonucleoside-diphosphate reductase subunit alpha n=1 Tax=Allofournierella sp. TaxID=1940256 RepID=UPI003AB74E0C
MNIKKRCGAYEPYNPGKITAAMQKAFASVGGAPGSQVLAELLASVERRLPGQGATVETVQDLVERALMEGGHFEAAKSYILYRQKRSELRAARSALAAQVGVPGLEECLRRIQSAFDPALYPLTALAAQFAGFAKPGMTPGELLGALAKAAVELTTPDAPQWEHIAARFLNLDFRLRLAPELARRGIGSFYEKVVYLTQENLYGEYILQNYTKSELEQAAAFLCDERDELFTWSGLDLLLGRYVIHTRQHLPLETPQEMFLGIALHLALHETRDRLAWVKKFYDMLSLLQVTMATPTLSNARKPYHQLSSCFIDTVPDSLEGIYRSLDNFARVSKFGGGMGLYFGKVRASGGSIRGFEGAAGGVIRWIKLVNGTAVAVDQLGMRQGAVAVYLDAWHKDLPEFLQLRTNNGDDRMKAHDVFPAVCWPDLFWKLARRDLDSPWHLMCPHDILTVKGYALEDYWGEEWERRYLDCAADPRIQKRTVTVKEVVRLVLKSAVETGTPFAFNRDTVNRLNPNGHAGVIYCSNLCTEIAQNMAPIETVSTELKTHEGDTVVVTTTRPGDFVVCNLASLSLGRLPVDDGPALAEVVRTAVRALDNVIDLNFYPLPYAQLTNQRYRSIGLGVSGYHHLLAKRGVRWESKEHLALADRVFESINRAAIAASCELAAEKGPYSLFAGSDWATGAYFEKRGYQSPEWQALAAQVRQNGMRNAYLLAVAPTSSTSILAGTTAGIDPVMNKFFLEEKKGSMLPRVAPELSPATYWYYKNAHQIDQAWSVRAAAVRQRHIDQAQSINLYITNDYTLRQVLELYLLAWEQGVKTIYYIRSKSLEVEECESCSS